MKTYRLAATNGQKLNWKSLFQPSFKHVPLLHNSNLVVLGKLLKVRTPSARMVDAKLQESDVEDEEEGIKVAESTGSWKPQLHYVWNSIFETYFPKSQPSVKNGRASFEDFFRVVVDGMRLVRRTANDADK